MGASTPHTNGPPRRPQADLRPVSWLFLRLGLTAFGGPAAHIAMMRDEVVRRRQWLTDQEFLDLVGATNLIPGPNSTEMAIHIGYRRAGWQGLVAAGVLFILPAALITLALAIAYVEFQSRPQLQWLLYGIKPAIIAIILRALWGMARPAARSVWIVAIGVGVLALYLIGVNEIALLFGGGALGLAARGRGLLLAKKGLGILAAPLWGAPFILAAPAAGAASVATLFLTMLKIGSVLYGSGYVLLAFLRADLVQRLGWLTEQQLLDAVAVGQFTPGPVLSTVTFVGYVVGGWPAAVVATLGIFLPAFVFVALLARILPTVRRSPWARAGLDGVNASSLGLMAGVAWQLGASAIPDWFAAALGIAALLVVFRTKLNSAWLLLASALAGTAYQALA